MTTPFSSHPIGPDPTVPLRPASASRTAWLAMQQYASRDDALAGPTGQGR
jgi:hypothetical protein